MKKIDAYYILSLLISIIHCSPVAGIPHAPTYDSVKKQMIPFLQEIYGKDISKKHDSVVFQNFHFYKEIEIHHLGKTQIFKNYTKGSYEIEKGTSYFFIGEENRCGLLTVEDSIFFVKTHIDDTSHYIATFHNLKDKTFQIHNYTNSSFQQVFDSWDDSPYLTSIPLSTYPWQEPEALLGRINSNILFENIDVNGDGWLDMKFSGIVEAPDYNLYNVGITSIEIEMIFLFDPNKESPHWYRHIENEEKSKPIYDTFQYLCTKKYIEEVVGLPFEGIEQ